MEVKVVSMVTMTTKVMATRPQWGEVPTPERKSVRCFLH